MSSFSFLSDVATILQTKDPSPLVKELAGLAWQGAEENKSRRIELFSDYIREHDLESVVFNNVSYDTLELLISLTHFRRARYDND